jgi:ferrochelatase
LIVLHFIIVAAYGSPDSLEEVEEYYTNILGHRPAGHLLSELKERYAAIGGHSPLNEITARQAAALQRLLQRRGIASRTMVGMKYHSPFIWEAIEDARNNGAEELLLLPLTPLNAGVSAESYLRLALDYVNRKGYRLQVRFPDQWHLNAHLLKFWHEAIESRLSAKNYDAVLFTAHSIPKRYADAGEPYPHQVREMASALASSLTIKRYEVAFQSAGRTGEEWIAPELEEVMRNLRNEGAEHVLIVPIGFVSEHLEVLYDIDIEAKEFADSIGLKIERTELPNDNSEFIEALGDVIEQMIQGKKLHP